MSILEVRIGQILFADAPFYERKSQAMDAVALAMGHQILPTADGAQLLHVYAPLQFPASRLSGVKVPYVANGRPSDSVFHSRPQQPARNVLPFGAHAILTALFKPELTQPRVDHGLSTRDRFRSERCRETDRDL